MLLRPGNAGSNTAADHITVIKGALTQLPGHKPGTRAGRKVLIRIAGAGATHRVLEWMTSQRLSYSVGYTLPAHTSELLTLIPDQVWTPACSAKFMLSELAGVAVPLLVAPTPELGNAVAVMLDGARSAVAGEDDLPESGELPNPDQNSAHD